MHPTEFKRLFRELARLYLTDDWNQNRFVKAQKLRYEILDARNAETITSIEYHVLAVMSSYLVDIMRDVFKRS